MDYICQHCGANLDKGDVFEHYLQVYSGDRVKALQTAKMHGWSETDRIHFNRSIIIQPDKDPQYIICPECKKKDPFSLKK